MKDPPQIDMLWIMWCCRFDRILHHLMNSMANGRAATKYIAAIDIVAYVVHAFPLPRMGKILSNPIEQSNLGLLGIHKFSPYKLCFELYYYL